MYLGTVVLRDPLYSTCIDFVRTRRLNCRTAVPTFISGYSTVVSVVRHTVQNAVRPSNSEFFAQLILQSQLFFSFYIRICTRDDTKNVFFTFKFHLILKCRLVAVTPFYLLFTHVFIIGKIDFFELLQLVAKKKA